MAGSVYVGNISELSGTSRYLLLWSSDSSVDCVSYEISADKTRLIPKAIRMNASATHDDLILFATIVDKGQLKPVNDMRIRTKSIYDGPSTCLGVGSY